MKKPIINFLVLILCFIFFSTVNATDKEPGLRKIFLYNLVTKEIKSNCTEIMGKHDFKPRYECFDEKTVKSIPIDADKDWTIVKASSVCMRNTVTGVVKTDCLKYESGKDGNVNYFYVYPKTREHIMLSEEWEPLPLNDPMCEPLKFGTDDPIKSFELDSIFDLEKFPEKGDENERKQEKE